MQRHLKTIAQMPLLREVTVSLDITYLGASKQLFCQLDAFAIIQTLKVSKDNLVRLSIAHESANSLLILRLVTE